MNKSKLIVICLVGAFFSIIMGVFYMSDFVSFFDEKRVIKVGIPAYWGTIVPSLQHTAYADAILSNQFQTLVNIGPDGTIIPSAAKSWSISTNLCVYTFKIDTSKQFSDGTFLKAFHFKKAWEYGVKLAPKSSNSSLMDTLYKVEGISVEKDDIPGLVVVDDETFQIRFEKPFRMGLEYLSGVRIAVFLKKDDEYLGTGPYIIKETLDQKLILSTNPYSALKPSIKHLEIVYCPADKASIKMKNGELDLYYFAHLAAIEGCLSDDSVIGCWMGQERSHVTLGINGTDGSFFSNKNYRRALNYLIHEHIRTESLPNFHRINNMKIDPQFYLPFQSGRLDDLDVASLVKEGATGVKEMITATQEHPIRLITSEASNWIQETLEEQGVKFTDDSGWISTPDRVKVYYKTFDADILVVGVGVALGDPDGLYHALGKNGAILSPMVYREKVAQLLEEGRSIMVHDQLHEHYKKVSKAILEEVPFVHLGFSFGNVAYRKDRLKINSNTKNRNEDGLNLFSIR